MQATEDVDVQFTACGIRRIAELGWEVNETTENIGARRLHTMMEKLLEDILFQAPDLNQTTVYIDAAYVDSHLLQLAHDEDLSRYIL